MPAPEDLTSKIKEGLIKSGFPLEMRVGSILDNYEWPNSIGRLYFDFETGKTREIDLTAERTLNGFAIHLEISCKKSTEKQLILYAPQNRGLRHPFFTSYLKAFPSLSWKDESQKGFSSKRILAELEPLNFFNKIPVANKLIVSKGNIITDDNVKFLSDINGLIKHSIITSSDGYIETNFRIIYLYILVFDGHIFNLSRSADEDFNLQSVEYGKLLYENSFKFSGENPPSLNRDLSSTAIQFGKEFIVEVMTPAYLEKYLQNIYSTFVKIDKSNLLNWGHDWNEYRKEHEL